MTVLFFVHSIVLYAFKQRGAAECLCVSGRGCACVVTLHGAGNGNGGGRGLISECVYVEKWLKGQRKNRVGQQAGI